jgi:DNA polymerase III subunit chi
MTQIAFHFNVPDKLAYACRLLRKAMGQGTKVIVLGDFEQIEALNQSLWSFSAHDFVPHCLASDAPSVRQRSPVLLANTLQGLGDLIELPTYQVLLNLGLAVPVGFESFERLIELVAVAEQDRDPARQRWKDYKERGFDILRHDLAQKEPA